MPRIYAESGGMEGGISVERLTDKHFNKTLGYYMKCSGCCERAIACNECEEFEALVDRLGDIEDILGDDYDIDRLRDLVEADRGGRCVVLPCKIDDEVYVNIMGKTLPSTVISISQITETPTFKAMHGVQLCFIFKSDDCGKTVFLTHEAAEAALKGE